jgi:hypothetical protein
MYRATLKYDAPLIVRAVRSYWRRSLGWSTLLGVPALCAYLAYLVMSGDRSWRLGLAIGAAAVGVLMPFLVYRVHFRNSMAKLQQMRSPSAVLDVEQDSFTVTSDIGASTLRWDTVKELWRFDEYWLFLFSRAHFMTIPLVDVSADMRAFIRERVTANGGKDAV